MPRPTNTKITAFRRTVQSYFRSHERDLPWRRTADPYAILVSEIMLQQTQVDRVIPKYEAFLQHFPTATALARAPQGAVLRLWQGLGYNRRALYLKDAAAAITEQYGGIVPRDVHQLKELPGIGPYTAAAVATFAFNQPHVLIETNIRAVYLHHFFAQQMAVPDTELVPLIARTLSRRNPRRWYWALMDYGSHLKRTHANPSRQSRHHVRQSAFAGSNRQLRGAILRTLTATPQHTLPKATLLTALPEPAERVEKCLYELINEGFIVEAHKGGEIVCHL